MGIRSVARNPDAANHRSTWRIGAVLLVAAFFLSGCAMFTGPDWSRIENIADKQLAAAKEFRQGVDQLTQPPSGNAGQQAHLAYQVRMASYQVNWDRFEPTVLNDVLAYVGQREGRQLQAAGLMLQAADMGLRYTLGGSGSSGGNKIVFKGGNRTAKGGGGTGGADGPGGGGSSASGNTSFENIYVTLDKSNAAFDSERIAQGKDSQIQEGDGTQGQVFSRPFNQPNINTPGGESQGGNINNDSEGLNAEGSLE